MVSDELKLKICERLNRTVSPGKEEPWNRYNELIINMAEELIKMESEYDYLCGTCGSTVCVETDLEYVIQTLKNEVKK